MQVSSAFNAPVASTTKPQPRVQPVSAIVRYPEAGSHEARGSARETTLEGEFLRGTAGGNPAAAHQTAIPGMLINAARAVSAYTSVSNSTATDATRARRRLDLHV